MKRKLQLLLLAVISCASGCFAKTGFASLPENSFGMAVSPNGRYVIGIDLRYELNSMYLASFIYDTETRSQEWITEYDANDVFKGGTLSAISDNGVACGHSKDPGLEITFVDFDGEYKSPANRATVWKNGVATQLGYGDFDLSRFTALQDGTKATAISADGTKVAGNFNMGNGTYSLPCVWSESSDGKWTPAMLPMPEGISNSDAEFMSADGNTIAGTVSLSSSQTIAAYWKDGVCNVIDHRKMGFTDDAFIIMDVKGLSANGRFMTIITNYRNFWIIDITTGEYRIMPMPDATRVTNEMSVDDNGNVLGTHHYGTDEDNYSRPFIYTYTDNRLFDLSYYINLYAPGLETDFPLAFEDKTRAVPRAVSASGNVIMGNTDTWPQYGQTPKCWVVQMEKTDIDIPTTPSGVAAKSEELGQVRLSWDKDNSTYKNLTLKSYNIYRDGKLSETLDANANKMETVQTGVPSGHPVYTIEGVYVKGDGTEMLSPKSAPCTASVPDTYQLPLYDDFESKSLQTNFWDNSDGVWTITANGGISGAFIRDFNTPTTEPHSTCLTTRKLDATNQQTVQLSFVLIYGLLNGNDWPLDRDSLSVEYSTDNGETWTVRKEWSLADLGAPYNWSMQHLDLTEEVAGKMFLLRLRNHGQGKAQYDFAVDNFKVGTGAEEKAPENMTGAISNDGNSVQVAWKNSFGAYSLSHAAGLAYATQTIGGEGKEIIAANKFDASDLKIYKGKYLSGASAYLALADYGSPEYNKIHASVVVFEDGKLIREQEITDISFNGMTTVALDNPVEIDPARELMVGIRIFDYSEYQYPLVYIQSNDFIAGKSDLYSEDGGTTWLKVSDLYPEQDYGSWGFCSWYIAGCVTDRPAFVPEATKQPLGYNVFRNGEIINYAMINDCKSGFTDTKPAKNACYDVVAYYLDGNVSEHSEQWCMSDASSIDKNVTDGIEVRIHPGTDNITINGDFTKARLFTTDGVAIAQSKGNTVPLGNISTGIYLLQIESGSNVTVRKIVIRR